MSFPTSDPGGYVLELHLTQPTKLQVGRLGEFTFPAGVYLYFGSACGPGGLRARLTRHLLQVSSQPVHWHIDYLRAVAELRALGYLSASCQEPPGQCLECLWSQTVARLPGSQVPVPRFGASDCRSGCPAHLLLIHEPDAACGSFLLDHRMQKILANAAGLPSAGQELGWLKIDQSLIPSLG